MIDAPSSKYTVRVSRQISGHREFNILTGPDLRDRRDPGVLGTVGETTVGRVR
ncbi:hypothetical protein AN958_03090 [Leucoagaricus sp. SymC.cos]|nr:hypothetical protein AN958_03090 [Leucoagaricus sp. SymC.cos]